MTTKTIPQTTKQATLKYTTHTHCCTCPDWVYRGGSYPDPIKEGGRMCKHMAQVRRERIAFYRASLALLNSGM